MEKRQMKSRAVSKFLLFALTLLIVLIPLTAVNSSHGLTSEYTGIEGNWKVVSSEVDIGYIKFRNQASGEYHCWFTDPEYFDNSGPC